jgi:protein O-mannosyl-transferase
MPPVKKSKKNNIKAPKPTEPLRSDANEVKKVRLWTFLIAVISIIIFSPAFSGQFLNWDDFAYIRDNTIIKNLSAINITHIFDFDTRVVGNYHPLTVLSYAIEYKLVGLKPFLYHFDNILLHVINILLVSALAWRLSKQFLTTIITTALFAIHPMRVESVVWAAERKDVLYSMFFLLALLSYLNWLRTYKIRDIIFCGLFYLFSILSKGQAVVLPLVLLLLDYWERRPFGVKQLLEKIPFFALSIVFGLLATSAQASSLTQERLSHYPFIDRIFFASYNLLAYPFKLIFPYRLSAFYGYPFKNEMLFYYLCLPVVIFLFSFIIWKFRSNRNIIFGTLFFLSTIFIVIQVLPVGNAIIADRYTYIPYIGLFFMAATLINHYIRKNPQRRKTVILLLTVQLIIFSGKTYIQAGTWKTSETLWNQALKINDREAVAHNNLGIVLLEKNKYDEAIRHFNAAIENRGNYPEYYMAYSNLGKAYADQKMYDKAIEAYNLSIRSAPTFAKAYFNRGLIYTDTRWYDLAIFDFTKAIELSPSPELYYSRAMAKKNKGLPDEAIADYSKAIELNPQYADAYMNRGNTWFIKNEYERAIEDYNQSLRYNPANGSGYLNRSKVYFTMRKLNEALADYRLAEQNNASEPGFLAAIQTELNKK